MAAQRPGQRLARAQPFPRAGVGIEQFRQGVATRREAQGEFVEVEAGQHGVAGQARRGVERFGRGQRRQLAALHGIEADELQWLQRRAQQVAPGALHAARNQAQPAMLRTQHLHQQAAFAPGAGMQDEGRLGGKPHALQCQSL